MHPLTNDALKRLKAEGINVTPEDAISLNCFAEKTSKPSDQRLLEHSGKYCGNVEIFPLTLGAKVWLKGQALEWFENEQDIYYFALFYAMAHSRFPDKFVFKNAKECRKVLHKWAKTINVSEDELLKLGGLNEEDPVEGVLKDLYDQIKEHPSRLNLIPVIKHLNGRRESHREEGTSGIVAWLIANCGQTVEYWLWERSWDETEELIKATQKNMTGEKIIDASDPSILAMREFQNLLQKIRMNNNLKGDK